VGADRIDAVGPGHDTGKAALGETAGTRLCLWSRSSDWDSRVTHYRVGILGGSFDPIHFGHLIMAENACDQLGLDAVVFAPAGSPPHKPDQQLAPGLDRLAMIRAAIEERDEFTISTIDMDRDGPSYTWKLLERYTGDHPEAVVHFVMGGDSLQDFATWSRPERVLELARIAVIERPGFVSNVPDVPGLKERIDVIETPLCDVSSTDIRQRVATGKSIRYLVPEAVREYIAARGLYRS